MISFIKTKSFNISSLFQFTNQLNDSRAQRFINIFWIVCGNAKNNLIWCFCMRVKSKVGLSAYQVFSWKTFTVISVFMTNRCAILYPVNFMFSWVRTVSHINLCGSYWMCKIPIMIKMRYYFFNFWQWGTTLNVKW